MIERHRIRGREFDALASDEDDTAAVENLRRSQYSRRLLLLRAILDRAGGLPRTTTAFAVLTLAQEVAPAVVEEVLVHPSVGSWAAVTLRSREAAPADLAHLGAIAAAAAHRARMDFEVPVAVHSGRVVLPTVGSAELPGVQEAVVQSRGGETTILGGSTRVTVRGRGWRTVPQLSATANDQQITVILDDADPYRNYPGLAPAADLTDDEVGRWREVFARSWALLVAHHGSLARSIAATLSSVVPLETAGDATVSGTSSEAFGAAALSLPDNSLDLAVTLVHEAQHSKLGALLDLVSLYREDSDQLFYAPWRDDPRPAGGLLHGCYAHFGIADFWRVQRDVTPGRDHAVAQFEYDRWRRQTLRTCWLLSRSGTLTPPGARFVAGMTRTLGRWPVGDVPARVRAAVKLAGRDHRISWRLRNLRPDDALVEQLADAWKRRSACPTVEPTASTIGPAAFSAQDGPRAKLLRRWLREPCLVEPRTADECLVAGDLQTAAEGYRTEIGADPTGLAAWSGWALARGVGRPETVLAVHRAVLARSSEAVDPDDLARWLVPTTG